jgi:hypothetical protein
MPSFIYIARIRSLSEELAQSLRSAGCHVESFKPGQVTQDECLLAMTPEAADGALHPDRAGTETERKGFGVPAALTVPLPQTDAAVWDSLKIAIAKEFHDNVAPPAATASAVEPAAETKVEESSPTPKPAEQAGPSTPGKVNQQARIEPPPIVAVSSTTVSADPKLRPAMERFYRVLRSPLSTVAAVLVFGILYRGLPAMTASGRMVTQSEAGPVLVAEPSHGKMQTVQRRQSSDSAVAEDFTRRVAMQASTAGAQKNLDLKRGQGASIQKRIVMD